jgi:hypothetical protein
MSQCRKLCHLVQVANLRLVRTLVVELRRAARRASFQPVGRCDQLRRATSGGVFKVLALQYVPCFSLGSVSKILKSTTDPHHHMIHIYQTLLLGFNTLQLMRRVHMPQSLQNGSHIFADSPSRSAAPIRVSEPRPAERAIGMCEPSMHRHGNGKLARHFQLQSCSGGMPHLTSSISRVVTQATYTRIYCTGRHSS